MKVTLPVCAVIATALSFSPLGSVHRASAQPTPAPTPPTVRAAPTPSTAAPAPAAASTPAPRTLPELPDTVVVGAPAGVGAPGGINSGSTIFSSDSLGRGTPLGQSGSSVSVITAEQIQQRQQVNVGEMLRGLPGVNVFQSGGPGQPSAVFIRGASSEQTKVLIDGIPANDPITVGRTFDFSTLSVDNVERIEVIRGPQSTLYGSDAIGGVVNIITKKGNGPNQGTVSAQGGSFGTSRESASISGSQGAVYYSAGASYWNTNGFSAADSRLPGNTEPDGFQNGNFSTRFGAQVTDQFDAECVVRYIRSNAKTDYGGGAFYDDPTGQSSTDQLFTRVQLHRLGTEEIWEQWLSFNTGSQTRDFTSQLNQDLTSPNYNNSTFSHTNGQTRFLDWRHGIRLHETNTIYFGASYYHEEGLSNLSGTFDGGGFPFSYGPSTTAGTVFDTAVYFQDQIKLGERWFTNIGVRQDNYNLAGLATTYRLSSLYRLPVTETAIRGSLGTGFKAPSVFQLYDTQFGNPTLRPEQSQGYDFGFDQPLLNNRVVVGATYFHNTFTNLIDFLQSGLFTSQYYNVSTATTSGVEITALWRIDPRTSITTTYTKLDSFGGAAQDPLKANQQLLRRPQDSASIGFNRRVLNNRANVNLSVIYVGQRDDLAFPPGSQSFPDGTFEKRVKIDPYVVANLAASYDLTRAIQLFGRIDNLTDTRYQDVYGFGTPPFSGYAGASLRW